MLQALDYQNSWIAAVDGAERRLPLWAALIYALGVFAAAMAAAQAVVGLVPAAFVSSGAAAAFFAVLLVGGWAAAQWIERRSQRPRVRPIGGALLGAVTGGCALLAAVAACWAAGALIVAGPVPASAVGLTLLTALIGLGALAEEVFFRGWLQPLLSARLGPWIGVVAAASLFSVAHGVGSDLGPAPLFNGFLAGVFFGVLAMRTGSLAAPTAGHFAWNWLEIAGLGLFPNPGVEPGALSNLDLTGPAVISGGSAGLNGSAAVTLSLLLVCAVLILLPGAGSAQLRGPDGGGRRSRRGAC